MTHGTSRRTASGAVLLAAALAIVSLPSRALAAENLELVPDVTLLVILVAVFAALIAPVNALIFKPIFHALDERASRIEGARHRAEHIAAEADTVLARYEESIREARASAEASRKEMVGSARKEQASIAAAARGDAEALVEKARAELGGALAEARGSLRASAEELGRLAAERILGRPL
jgi:F-type H+-transporting ATPase subunit b